MSKYIPVRVSSKDQNPARQIAKARELGIPEENIFIDKVSGRRFDRPEYDRMKSLLKPGDEVYFHELDRIGRNKAGIKNELAWFKENKIVVRILNVPTTLIEFPVGQEWVLEMVNNILIEVLSAMAEQEWERTTKRRNEGIEAMPVDENGRKISSRTGRGFGRPELEIDLTRLPGETVVDACKRLGISRNTYYRKLQEVSA